MTPVPSVANMVLHELGNAGAETVFGLPGAHNLAFWRGAPGLRTPRLVNVRHEQTAVYAADGWARASGRLGAAVVTTGPGAANTMAAFGEAAASGSPLVLIASEVPLRLTDMRMRRTLHQSRDQAGMFGPLAKAIFKPRSPQEVAQDIGRAMAAALSAPRGPVYMDVPTDVLSAPAVPVSCPPQLTAGFVDEKALDQAARLINSAGPIAIWAGGGVVAARASAQLASLASHLQAPVFTTFSSRGVLGPADPCSVGLPPHEPEVEDLLASADVLLGIGTDFDGMMTKNAKLRLPRTIIDINVDLERTSFGYEGVWPVLGDAKVAIETLLRLTKPRDNGLITGLQQLKQRVWARLCSRSSHARSLHLRGFGRAHCRRRRRCRQRHDNPQLLARELLPTTERTVHSVPHGVGDARLCAARFGGCCIFRRAARAGGLRRRRLHVRARRASHDR